MTNERDYIRVEGKVPKFGRDGSDLTYQDLGPGGPRRPDGTLSALAYDLVPIDEDPEEDSDDDEQSLSAIAGLALAGLTVGAIGLAIGKLQGRKERRRERQGHSEAMRSEEERAAPEPVRAAPPSGWYDDGHGRERWWDGHHWTEHVQRSVGAATVPAGWYEDGSGAYRWWDGQQWTEHFYQPVTSHNGMVPNPSVSSSMHKHGAELHCQSPRIVMGRHEWLERMRAMLFARAFSEAQWTLLSAAQIEGAEGPLIEWQQALRKLTPQQFTTMLNHELTVNPQLRGQLEEAWSRLPYTNWETGASHSNRPLPEHRPLHHYKATKSHYAPTPAGWYDDGSGQQRWWDGQRWASH